MPNQHFFKPPSAQLSTQPGTNSFSSVFKKKGGAAASQDQSKKNCLTSFDIIKQKFGSGKGLLTKTPLLSLSSDVLEKADSAANEDPFDNFMDQIQSDAIK